MSSATQITDTRITDTVRSTTETPVPAETRTELAKDALDVSVETEHGRITLIRTTRSYAWAMQHG